MKWSSLSAGKERIFVSFIIVLYAYPIIIWIEQQLALDTLNLKIALWGGLLYAIYYVGVLFKCPTLIANHKSMDEYMNYCWDTKVNPHDEFSFYNQLPAEKIKSMLGDHLYPLEKGLEYSRQETFKQYAKINYDFYNMQNKFFRTLLGAIFLSSAIMINVPLISRIVLALWG